MYTPVLYYIVSPPNMVCVTIDSRLLLLLPISA